MVFEMPLLMASNIISHINTHNHEASSEVISNLALSINPMQVVYHVVCMLENTCETWQGFWKEPVFGLLVENIS